MTQQELNDVQGILKRGYPDMPYSNFVLLQIGDPVKAKAWIKSLLPGIDRGVDKKVDPAINLAFTYAGLAKLGLADRLMQPFSREFEEGMSNEARSRLLGDYDYDANVSKVPEWEWKDGDNAGSVHMLLMLYGMEETLVEEYCTQLNMCLNDNGLCEMKTLLTIRLHDSREHFGFRDGIGQPIIKEFDTSSSKEDTPYNIIALGEFVLGYPNIYGKLPDSPTIKAPGSNAEVDFGKNGTYLVMRQMEQDVKGFWEYMADNSKDSTGNPDMTEAVALASKFIGRWPGGAPLICSPDYDDPEMAKKNDFKFAFTQAENFGKCPVGAHIVRGNPRDGKAISEEDRDQALESANHHRILRRGRSYGRPFITSMKPEEILANANDQHEERGLHFICLNASISRQFEFIQNTWINDNKFCGLYNDADPVVGTYQSDHTIPQRPVSRRLKDVPNFVSVRGGGYFFLPSISSLEMLTNL